MYATHLHDFAKVRLIELQIHNDLKLPSSSESLHHKGRESVGTDQVAFKPHTSHVTSEKLLTLQALGAICGKMMPPIINNVYGAFTTFLTLC